MTGRAGCLAEIARALGTGRRIAIFPHTGLDADCIGSGAALKAALEKCGHTVRVFADDRGGDRFRFIPGADDIAVYPGRTDPPDFLQAYFLDGRADFAILEDCASPERTGACARLIPFCGRVAVIDHHAGSGSGGELVCADPDACATAELVYGLIRILEDMHARDLFDAGTAAELMAAIYYDTGGLRFSNTRAEAFAIAADLSARFQVDIRSISYNLFEKTPLSRLKIRAAAYSAATFHAAGRIAACLITRRMMEDCGASDDDLDGICNDLRNVGEVEAAFVLREKEGGEIRVNVRSVGTFDAAAFAARHGGGGHLRAAGFTLRGIGIAEAGRLIVGESTERITGIGSGQT